MNESVLLNEVNHEEAAYEAWKKDLFERAYYEAGLNAARCQYEGYLKYYALISLFGEKSEEEYIEQNDEYMRRDRKQIWKDLVYYNYESNKPMSEEKLRDFAFATLICKFIGLLAQKKMADEIKDIKKLSTQFVNKNIYEDIVEAFNHNEYQYKENRDLIAKELAEEGERFLNEDWTIVERVSKGLIYKGYLTPQDIRILVDYDNMQMWDYEFGYDDDENFDEWLWNLYIESEERNNNEQTVDQEVGSGDQ